MQKLERVDLQVVAIDPCEMSDTHEKTLTVGKVYDAMYCDDDQLEELIRLVDDAGDFHKFQLVPDDNGELFVKVWEPVK